MNHGEPFDKVQGYFSVLFYFHKKQSEVGVTRLFENLWLGALVSL